MEGRYPGDFVPNISFPPTKSASCRTEHGPMVRDLYHGLLNIEKSSSIREAAYRFVVSRLTSSELETTPPCLADFRFHDHLVSQDLDRLLELIPQGTGPRRVAMSMSARSARFVVTQYAPAAIIDGGGCTPLPVWPQGTPSPQHVYTVFTPES